MKVIEIQNAILAHEKAIKEYQQEIQEIDRKTSEFYLKFLPSDRIKAIKELIAECDGLKDKIGETYEHWYLTHPEESWDVIAGPHPEFREDFSPIKDELGEIVDKLQNIYRKYYNEEMVKVYGDELEASELKKDKLKDLIICTKNIISDLKSDLLWNSDDLQVDPELLTKIIKKVDPSGDPTKIIVDENGNIEYTITIEVSKEVDGRDLDKDGVMDEYDFEEEAEELCNEVDDKIAIFLDKTHIETSYDYTNTDVEGFSEGDYYCYNDDVTLKGDVIITIKFTK